MITSRNNSTVKHIRALRQRKEREATQTFWIEGIRIVAEAIHTGAAIEYLVVAPELLTSPYAHDLLAQASALPQIAVSATVFRGLSSKDGPQGLGAVVRQRWSSLAELAFVDGLCWVALHEASDPGNVGTILRTSDAVGASGVILLGHSTDPYDPTTARASMGSLFTQRLVRATWAEFAAWKQQHGWTVVGAADSAAVDYQAYQYQQPLVLVLGSEREGLSPEQQLVCDAIVSIPMVGRADSLNLAVATSVLLYEVFNQRRKG